jgi:hypothetical protein
MYNPYARKRVNIRHGYRERGAQVLPPFAKHL